MRVGRKALRVGACYVDLHQVMPAGGARAQLVHQPQNRPIV
jgi:hypothetical protein